MVNLEQQSWNDTQKNQPPSSKKFDVFADPKETEKRNDIATSIANDPTMIKLATEYKSSKEWEEKVTKANNSKEAVEDFLKSWGYNEQDKIPVTKEEETVAIDSKVKSIIANVNVKGDFYIDISTWNIIIKTMDWQNVRTLDVHNPKNAKRITPEWVQKWINRYTTNK